MEQLLQQSPELDGVICVTDVVALGAWGVLRKAGRQKFGQDIGLAGTLPDSWASAVACKTWSGYGTVPTAAGGGEAAG